MLITVSKHKVHAVHIMISPPSPHFCFTGQFFHNYSKLSQVSKSETFVNCTSTTFYNTHNNAPAIYTAQNRPLWRLMSTFGAMHS